MGKFEVRDIRGKKIWKNKNLSNVKFCSNHLTVFLSSRELIINNGIFCSFIANDCEIFLKQSLHSNFVLYNR